jgi:hypothetical protein
MTAHVSSVFCLCDGTPASTLNLSVSCESSAVPEYQPFTDRHPESNSSGETCIESAAPTTTRVPLIPKPPYIALILAALPVFQLHPLSDATPHLSPLVHRLVKITGARRHGGTFFHLSMGYVRREGFGKVRQQPMEGI